jgi:chromosome partitioning protein
VRLIAVINQKGGVGKTTTAVNLSFALSRLGKQVTVIDLDPQGHLATSFGCHQHSEGLDRVMLEGVSIESQTIEVRDNLKIIPAGDNLHQIEQLNEGGAERGKLLKDALKGHFEDQDFVFIDCPPSSGMLVVNALFAVDEVLIPMTGEYLALQGLSHLIRTIKNFEKMLSKKYLTWLVIQRFQARRRLAKDVMELLKKHFPNRILATVVREAAMVAECPGLGKTIIEHRPGSRAAREFRQLAEDMIEERVMV